MLGHVGLDDLSVKKSLHGRRASSEGILSREALNMISFSSPPSSPKYPKSKPCSMLQHSDILRRIDIARTNRLVGPSHMRVEVPAGIGAVGHARVSGDPAGRSRISGLACEVSSNIAPVGRSGMSGLQKSLLQTKSAGGNV